MSKEALTVRALAFAGRINNLNEKEPKMSNKKSKIYSLIVLSFELIFAGGMLNAAVVNITEGSTTGYTMTDGNTYVIQNSVSFSNTSVGGSGMSVADGATVVLYVPLGVTLTASGANGKGSAAGGAGIRVPETSVIIITGEGTVNANGGNAGDGAHGEGGTDGVTYFRNNYYPVAEAGKGARGGEGGGGAGAGIGGIGGQGGLPWLSGGNGVKGEDMGVVYVLGSIYVEASAGKSGKAGMAGNTGNGSVIESRAYAAGGGGGGGGGAGSSPTWAIGGGGSSGGAGGGGEDGRTNLSGVRIPASNISKGGGGASVTQKGGGSDDSYSNRGGLYGGEGSAGTLYVSSTANTNVDRKRLEAQTCPAAQYTITFDINGGMHSLEPNSVTATLGCALPDCIPAPIRQGYSFCGWKDENGIQYYAGDGTKSLSSYSETSDIVLYAEWVFAPDALIVAPMSGMMFEGSLTITMQCTIEGATIHYTLDGSDPTADSPVYKKFKISEKTTVKAAAFVNEGNHSDVVTCEYAIGRCSDPIVSPQDGTVFKHSGLVVTIDQNGEEGVLRYTIDGTDPTREAPVYEGPFTVDDSTVVKAKVFSDRYFDSAVVTVNLTREWETVPTPVITAAEEFSGSETKVMIACAMPEATIRYTTDGSEPNSHSPKYTGPFWVSESCTVKAVAMCVEYRTSEVASRTITKVWGIGDTMGVPDHAFATSGDAGFIRVEDATAPKGEAMRSGEIGNSAGYGLYSRSVLSTTVHGPCTLKFKWRCSCEEDDGFEWDHAEFAVDGEVKARINGIMDGWAEFTQVITEGGAHAVTWTYLKDSSEWDGEDCLWVADYSWTPTELYTHESSVPVPYDWIRTYLPHTAYEYGCLEAAVRETAANGVNTVEDTYVAGLDPSDPKDKFIAKIEMVDGKSVVTWTPDLNEDGTKSVRTYKTWGKDSLDADEWLEVTPENQDDMRFFKVTVGMP